MPILSTRFVLSTVAFEFRVFFRPMSVSALYGFEFWKLFLSSPLRLDILIVFRSNILVFVKSHPPGVLLKSH